MERSKGPSRPPANDKSMSILPGPLFDVANLYIGKVIGQTAARYNGASSDVGTSNRETQAML